MSPIVEKHEQAKRDLSELAEFIRKDNPRAAFHFLDAAEESFRTLAEMPMIGSVVEFDAPSLAGLRCWPVRGFRNHLIFYQPTSNGINVVGVLHGSRDIEAIFGK